MIRARFLAATLVVALAAAPTSSVAATDSHPLAYEVAAPTLGRIIMAIHASPLTATERSAGQELVFAYADTLRSGDRSKAEAALQTWVGLHLRSYEDQLSNTVRMLGEIRSDPTSVSKAQLPEVARTIIEAAMRPVPAMLSQTLEHVNALTPKTPEDSQHDLRHLHLMSAEIRHCQAALIDLHVAQTAALRTDASVPRPAPPAPASASGSAP